MSSAEHAHAVEGAAAELRALLGQARHGRRGRARASQPRRVVPPAGRAGPRLLSRARPTKSRQSCAISQRFQLPVIPFGAGTSLEGHVHALSGGISIDLREMNRVLRVSAEDLDATVEAGVTRKQLNAALRNTGLMFPVDPGADATIGGMAATRASGTTAVRYGTMRENVLGADRGAGRRPGDSHRHARAEVGGRLRPDAAVRRIRGHARRDHRGHGAAAPAARGDGRGGLLVRLDARRRRHRDRDDPARHPGRPHRAARRSRRWTRSTATRRPAIRSRRRCSSSSTATATRHVSPSRRRRCRSSPPSAAATASSGRQRPEERERLWQARHDVHYAALALRPGSPRRGRPTSACRSRGWPTASSRRKQDHADAPFPVCLVGHAGDGNFHLIYLIDPSSEAELAEVHRLNDRLVARALAMGGTCTGEHGVGYGKIKSLEAEHGEAVDVMRSIKRALDPDNRMNPGKVIRMARIADSCQPTAVSWKLGYPTVKGIDALVVPHSTTSVPPAGVSSTEMVSCSTGALVFPAFIGARPISRSGL